MEAKAVKALVLIIAMVTITMMFSATPALAGFPHCIRRCKSICKGQGCTAYNCGLCCFNNCLPGGIGSDPGCRDGCNAIPTGDCKEGCFAKSCAELDDEVQIQKCLDSCSGACPAQRS